MLTASARALPPAARIVFHGVVRGPAKRAAIDSCHMFVNPSVSEGQCIVALEVFAQGRCFVGTPVGSLPEMLGSGELGKEVLIAPRNLKWIAYLLFEDEGYVKDDEKIDANAILKSLTDSTEASNAERRRRGFPPRRARPARFQAPPRQYRAGRRESAAPGDIDSARARDPATLRHPSRRPGSAASPSSWLTSRISTAAR